MNTPAPTTGRVVSLHLHPARGGMPMRPVEQVEAVEQKGLAGNGRYFGRVSRSSGSPSRRQVTLMEREQIAEHATSLGLESIAPGDVRSNIETLGIDLISLIGRKVQVGEAVLHFYEDRTPCEKMDALCPGLRELMTNRRQGVLAEVLRSGVIRLGDRISPLPQSADESG